MSCIQDPCAPLVVVLANGKGDPAVDWTATNADEYRASRDLEALTLKGEEKPTKFYLRRLPATFMLQAMENVSAGEKTLLAIRASCFRVELPSGQSLTPKRTTKQLACDVAEEEWANELGRKYGLGALFELAVVAINFAGLPEDQRGPFA